MLRSRIDDARGFFRNARRIAVVGVSRDVKGFSRYVFRELLQRGLDAVPVNPALGEVAGVRAFPRVQDVEPLPDSAILMLPPARAEEVVRDCLVARVKRIWFHRGAGGPGAASEAALALCVANRIEVVQGFCPLMALPEAAFPHRLHAIVRCTTAHPAGPRSLSAR
jgi:predicted CoA-binding protein